MSPHKGGDGVSFVAKASTQLGERQPFIPVPPANIFGVGFGASTPILTQTKAHLVVDHRRCFESEFGADLVVSQSPLHQFRKVFLRGGRRTVGTASPLPGPVVVRQHLVHQRTLARNSRTDLSNEGANISTTTDNQPHDRKVRLPRLRVHPWDNAEHRKIPRGGSDHRRFRIGHRDASNRCSDTSLPIKEATEPTTGVVKGFHVGIIQSALPGSTLILEYTRTV